MQNSVCSEEKMTIFVIRIGIASNQLKELSQLFKIKALIFNSLCPDA